jgi:gas vesicle protein
MACKESSPRKQSIFEPPKKKRKRYHAEQPKITKETLLKALEDVEDEIKKLGHEILGERLKKVRGQVKVVLENQQEEIQNLRGEIQSLKREVENVKIKQDKLEKTLAVAQATWVWEAHLTRFVVDSSKRIYPSGKFRQMEQYLGRLKNPEDNRWTEIKGKLRDWTKEHWEVLNTVRVERNCIAHPDLIDLDLVESEIEIMMTPESQERMKDMLDILRMTASLMKFGRLAKFYERNKHLFSAEEMRGKGMDARVLKKIISWDRNFEEINGLQNIEHADAKKYLAKYVNDCRMVKHYLFIVDFIKDGNSKRLGKLAWKIEGLSIFVGKSTEYGEALDRLKKLLPNPKELIKDLDETTAKLHIPDFLPKHLWKHGIEIVEKYFDEIT